MGKHFDPLNASYPVRIRLVGIGVILSLAALFLLFPRISGGPVLVNGETRSEPTDVVDIPPSTAQLPPPRLELPSIPIKSDDVDPAEDVPVPTVEEYIPAELLPPLQPYEGPNIPFVEAYEEPVPVGGYAALSANVHYPEMARRIGVQGTVFVEAYIDEKGRVRATRIKDGLPNTGLDEAAVAAVTCTRWKPARQRDRPVAVWITIPIHFRLTN
jgi:protein TonB